MTHFDPDRALQWLQSTAVDHEGRVLSWVNPDHPGYAYPEAAAIVLRLLDASPRADPTLTGLIRQRLRRDVERGRVGKHGRTYPFDLGVALAGLCREDPDFVARLRQEVLAGLDAPRSFIPLPDGQRRWSTTRGPHLLKVAIGLIMSARALGRDAELEPLVSLPLEQTSDGRIQTPPHPATYVHAHCYAAEGLLALAHAKGGDETTRRRGVAAVHWLAKIQQADGSIPAWHDGRQPHGPCPADSCAQAIRLWCLVNPRQFCEPIDRAMSYLDRLTHEDGGLRYHVQSDDLNSWATAFAIQAANWARGGSERDPVAIL
jgi:hypothetical protein